MSGDPEFEKLVNVYYRDLYRFGLSLTGSEADAADLTQETFYIWANKGHQLNNPGNVKGWLFTTLHREFLKICRRQKRMADEPLGEGGSSDDGDPQLREALAHAQGDPELARWLREQTSCYNAIRSKLRQIEPPSGFAEKVIRSRPIPFRRDWNRILQLAAAIIISACIT